MNIRYFYYHFENQHTGEKIRFDIRPFLKQFAALDAPAFKNKIKRHDEYLYITHQFTDIFMLIQTKRNEIIRKINTENLSVEEVNSLLEENEHFGFASYLSIKEDYFGICSTLLAPRFESLTLMMGQILDMLNIDAWRFVVTPILTQIAPSKVSTLAHIGRTVLRLPGGASLAESVASLLSKNVEPHDYVEDIEIIIRPKKNRNLSPLVQGIIHNVPEDQVSRMKMRAKDSASSAMMDVYLAESGAVSDRINSRSKAKIAAAMEDKMSQNKALARIIKEYRDGPSTKPGTIDDIAHYSTADGWSDVARGV